MDINDTRSRVLHTAITLFSQKGYSTVSLRQIASAVGISAPALYNHFSSKEALYQEAVSTAFADKATLLLAMLEDESLAPQQRLQGFIESVCHSIDQDPAFRALMQRELLDGQPDRLAFLGRSIFNQVQQPFMTLLQELKPGCDAFLLSQFIFGLVKQHFDMKPLHPHLELEQSSQRSPRQIAALAIEVLAPYFSFDVPE
jgi:AcrR family transcriptional regulator